jgi:hypothetical protein
VPYQYLGKKVRILYGNSTVEVYYRHELIASHPRTRSAHNYTTASSHMPTQHQYQADWNPEHFLNQARQIDPEVEKYVQQVLLRKAHPEQAYKSCQGILSFAKRVGPMRLINACSRAADYNMYNYRIIEQILLKGLDQAAKEEHSNPDHMPLHENIRGNYQ